MIFYSITLSIVLNGFRGNWSNNCYSLISVYVGYVFHFCDCSLKVGQIFMTSFTSSVQRRGGGTVKSKEQVMDPVPVLNPSLVLEPETISQKTSE